jgi:hypothetical protein
MTNEPENAVLCSTCIHTVTICDHEPNFDNTIGSVAKNPKIEAKF